MILALTAILASASEPYDVAVYGASGAACTAAIAASRSGAKNVVLLSQTNHVGGMLTGGLQHTDSANAKVIQGITREFFIRTEEQYPGRNTSAGSSWLFESHVGEHVMLEMLNEAHIQVIRSVGGVVDISSTKKRIESVTFESAVKCTASVWIDASYEGGIVERIATTVWGREGRIDYGEADAGRGIVASIGAAVSPYWDANAKPYDTPTNILPHVSSQIPAEEGGRDLWIEPYDFRLCFTNSPGNKLNFTKPASYNASEFELWRRIYAVSPPKNLATAGLSKIGPIPNNYSDCPTGEKCVKYDMLGMNHGTDLTDGSWGYPNGTNAQRAAIWRRHIEFTQGLLWFWVSDPAVPEAVRRELAQYGHCTDEYDADSSPPHWPHQLYVREAKRLVGAYVWTEFMPNASMQNRSVGLGSYNFDSHYVSRIIQRTGNATADIVVKEGRVKVQQQQTNGSSPTPSPSPSPGTGLDYGCATFAGRARCVAGMPTPAVAGNGSDAGCGGACAALAPHEWLAVKKLSEYSADGRNLLVTLKAGQTSSWLKKGKQLADSLPPSLKLAVTQGEHIALTDPHSSVDDTYDFVSLVAPTFEPTAGSKGVSMPPFTMPYDAMLPKLSEVTNVFSPVAISATHIRYNAVRMEPTWMIYGHAAGAAAALVAKYELPSVHAVDVAELQELLVYQKQLLRWPPS